MSFKTTPYKVNYILHFTIAVIIPTKNDNTCQPLSRVSGPDILLDHEKSAVVTSILRVHSFHPSVYLYYIATKRAEIVILNPFLCNN